MSAFASRLREMHTPRVWAVVGAVGLLVTLLPLFGLPAHLVPLFGKFLCFGIAALAMDLVWGYAGILSLGHGLFFALGGYGMGMYLMRSISGEGVYRSTLPDFMVFLDWKELPWYWQGFDHFGFAAAMSLLAPGALALVFGWFAFRSRIRGVYFSIVTQALTYAATLLFFQNATGFGGNNGLTDFKRILGAPLHDPGTRATLYVASAIGAKTPAEFAISRCWPGSRIEAVVHDAFRVTVLPVDVAYTTSRPVRSTATAPAFEISANSSDADAPPVWTSETTSVEVGHATAAASSAGSRAADGLGPTRASDARTRRSSTAWPAPRTRSIDHLPAGAGG